LFKEQDFLFFGTTRKNSQCFCMFFSVNRFGCCHDMTHRRMAWGVKRGRRRPQAIYRVGGPLLKWPYGCFRVSLPARHKRVGHGGRVYRSPWRVFRESKATPCHTPLTICLEFNLDMEKTPSCLNTRKLSLQTLE
jgi:hypothetical protein